MPQIVKVMTPFPYSIGIDDTIDAARALMAEHGVHHLPVRDGNAPVSVISDRDLLDPAAPSDARRARCVRDVCAPDVYVVDVSEPLDTVLSTMADRRIGSALVTKHGHLAGIFTATDACRWFGEYLRARFPLTSGAREGDEGDDIA